MLAELREAAGSAWKLCAPAEGQSSSAGVRQTGRDEWELGARESAPSFLATEWTTF